MDYFFNNPGAFLPHGSHRRDDNLPELVSSSSSSSQSADQLFDYANANTDVYQATDQNWAPLDLDNLLDFAGDELQVLEPGSTSASPDGEKEEQQTTKLRRRAQNRASQRAFRERKDRHLKGLEYQLEHLSSKHQDLMQSYMKQSEGVVKLNSRLTELRTQVKALKTHQRLMSSAHAATGTAPGRSDNDKRYKSSCDADSFDAFSFISREAFGLDEERESSSSLLWHDMMRSSTGGDAADRFPGNDLPAFEDLLQLS
ncbi:uncharacterized protein A1O9_02850 [Exophiala aquamarina CBS 119918]|uniref:BZIP domain-containing protein n=1 Tax=Exophiala aquamarina CBS 119918 TaxID=1182545 RepID=A0A072Q0A0_9EURO|nr:uncharacterized protein A1O9_02850 [Exophiala aquamarina CBS 119918]KEF61285.1 hypothetical protein A1O9_02850 [Exophiala aquamarina CBS 119918]